MTGNSSIDLSLSNIWWSWTKFRIGKKITHEVDDFTYYLEANLYQLYVDLKTGQYRHGRYRNFVVNDNKRREISVASIRDRVVHRLVYEYLVGVYDHTFVFDVWSCRKRRGSLGAIDRTQKFLYKYRGSYVWRSDIQKFFDNVSHKILLEILQIKIVDSKALNLLQEVIQSYGGANERERERE